MVDHRKGAQVPAGYNPLDYQPVGVTVDIVLLTIRQGKLMVLLVQRAEIRTRTSGLCQVAS